jgi:hypothetical protein
MSTFLAVVSLLVALLGLLFASQATIGVALVCFGCLLAIYARLAQAHVYHRELHADPSEVAYKAWRQQEQAQREAATGA